MPRGAVTRREAEAAGEGEIDRIARDSGQATYLFHSDSRFRRLRAERRNGHEECRSKQQR